MDQRDTTTSTLLRQMDDPHDLAYFLGEALRAPVRDIPTMEDWQREQGVVGLPSESATSRDVGQGTLDYTTMAHGLINLLRGGGAAAQELMGKQRGVETFGKEMMETSRRAQPQRWRDIRSEEREHFSEPNASPYGAVRYGRKGWDVSDATTSRPMPPEGLIGAEAERGMLRQHGTPPQDRVRTMHHGGYQVGETVSLPGDTLAGYYVTPTPTGGYKVVLDYVATGNTRSFDAGTYASIGEATAKARQLANRLDLAAEDLRAKGWMRGPNDEPARYEGTRDVRLPWEPGTMTPARTFHEPWPGWWRHMTNPPSPSGGPQ